ncbi:MAG: zinc-binding dehydrogenase [Acidimicrobiales bacterium]
MRAVQVGAFGAPDVLEVCELPEPVAGPGEVTVGVAIAPVLFVDTQVRAGLAQDWFPARPPYVPGVGVAGHVAAVGAGVDPGWVGRRVVADSTEHGGYLERAVVPADALVAVPDAVGLAEAAALLHDGRTALGLVEVTEPRPGEWVLVVGAAGGLGILLVQLAHEMGAHVLGAARGERKLALARKHGADAVVDYAKPQWVDEVAAMTGGAGPDLTLDGVGGPLGSAAFEATAAGGRFSAHGAAAGPFAPIDPRDAEQRRVTVFGIDRVQFTPEDARRLTVRVLELCAAGRVSPVIGQTFPLEHAADAHRAIESRAVIGKTLLEV